MWKSRISNSCSVKIWEIILEITSEHQEKSLRKVDFAIRFVPFWRSPNSRQKI